MPINLRDKFPQAGIEERRIRLKKSIDELGLLCPVLVDKHGNVIDGRERLLVDEEAPIKRVPCFEALEKLVRSMLHANELGEIWSRLRRRFGARKEKVSQAETPPSLPDLRIFYSWGCKAKRGKMPICGHSADRGVFPTLTINPRNFVSLHQAYRSLQRAWNKLLSMLRKRFKRLEFVMIPEFTKEGIVHLHVLFPGIPRLIDADELREFWDRCYGMGKIVHLRKLYSGSNRVVSYLVKYMTKLLDAPDHEFKGSDGLIDAQAFIQVCLAWALNLRAFSTSRSILDTSVVNGLWLIDNR